MDSILFQCSLYTPQPSMITITRGLNHVLTLQNQPWCLFRIHVKLHFDTALHFKKPKTYQDDDYYPRQTEAPRISKFEKPGLEVRNHTETDLKFDWGCVDPLGTVASNDEEDAEAEADNGTHVWEPDEIEAISSLFQGRIPQKPGKLNRVRPLPLPLPHKVRPIGFPVVKKHIRTSSLPTVFSRMSRSKQLHKDPVFLLYLAREIRSLPLDKNASSVLARWGKFLHKGSLSLTIRELGYMGLPDRALQAFCWAQKQTHLFPDDRILAATVETLARGHELKLPCDLNKFVTLASRSVLEAIARGFIRGKSLHLAWKLLSAARKGKRMLGSSIYAKLISELAKSPDKDDFTISLLQELAERDTLDLSPQDCSAIMKVCTRLGKFEFVECLFDWFQKSGNQPSVVMYTTVIHSRLCAKNFRESLALVWEMERLDCLFDLPAYRVAVKTFVALNDLPRAVRYFSKIKEAGFSPTYDIYRDMIVIYLLSGRLAKCKEVYKEVELAGYKVDAELRSELLQLEKTISSRV